jgi:3-oxoacyl-[acyl-carrier-protein] synthase I
LESVGKPRAAYYRWLITSSRPLAIQAVGAFAGAGTNAPRAIGAARLGLKFFEELPSLDAAGNPIIGAPAPLDLKAVIGVERLVTMAALALAECAGDEGHPAALLVCMPEPVGGSFAPNGLLAILGGEARASIDATRSHAFPSGRGAIFDALAEAARLLSMRVVRTAYVLGVDSVVDREPLDRHLRAGRVKVASAEGFVPGEAAACLRLQLDVGKDTLALISGVATAHEPCPRGAPQPNSGEGLARAARGALAAASISTADVGAFIHDASGDRFGFREAAMAITRLGPRAAPAAQVWTPAASTGEIGAAAGPFALAMAATLLHRRVTPGPAALVLGTSDGTARGAAAVTLPSPPAQGRSRR